MTSRLPALPTVLGLLGTAAVAAAPPAAAQQQEVAQLVRAENMPVTSLAAGSNLSSTALYNSTCTVGPSVQASRVHRRSTVVEIEVSP